MSLKRYLIAAFLVTMCFTSSVAQSPWRLDGAVTSVTTGVQTETGNGTYLDWTDQDSGEKFRASHIWIDCTMAPSSFRV